MRKSVSKRLAAVFWATLLGPLVATASDGEAIMVHGAASPQVMPCITCHGSDGMGMAAAGFPRLAGLPAPYIVKQLGDFRSGARQNPIMEPIAKALTDEEIAAVARAYAARPPVNVTATAVERPVRGTGAWLALRGAWERNIPECTLCHGPGGVGVGESFPPLAGQSAMYLEAQLKAWKGSVIEVKGKRKSSVVTRRNDPDKLMQHIAADLSDAEIKAVAEYFSSLGDSSEPFNESQRRLR